MSGSINYDPATDQWNGPFTIAIEDQDGNEIFSDNGTMSGTGITPGP